MNFIQAIILGIVQGLAEFLPISSSAHLNIVARLLTGEDAGAAFAAIIQIGTIAAVIIYFFKDIVQILSAWFKAIFNAGGPKSKGFEGFEGVKAADKQARWTADAKMGNFIILGTIPVVIAGLLLQKHIEGALRNLWITAAMLLIFGVILELVDRSAPKSKALGEIDVKSSIIIGLAQCLSLIPGVSRSGATIIGARGLGFSRLAAARFSFLISIPAILGSGLLEFFKVLKDGVDSQPGFPGWPATIIATIISFAVGYGVIAWFMKALQKISFRGFAIYRVVVALLVFALLGLGVLAP